MKAEYVGGVLFTVCGVLLGGAFVLAGVFEGDFLFMGVGGFFLMLFPFIGIVQIRSAAAEAKERKDVLARGCRQTGTIHSYEDGSGAIVNGVPPLDIIVEVSDGTGGSFVRIPTGEHSESKFPIGAKVDFCTLGDVTVVVPDSVRW